MAAKPELTTLQVTILQGVAEGRVYGYPGYGGDGRCANARICRIGQDPRGKGVIGQPCTATVNALVRKGFVDGSVFDSAGSREYIRQLPALTELGRAYLDAAPGAGQP